ncbi:MAG: TIGR00730 family Rossman fold protein [Syntrophobacteraceae bacterium]|nr:TIGR00730 family Rossman fold protein [Syntrophobacteraceae bacterium]
MSTESMANGNGAGMEISFSGQNEQIDPLIDQLIGLVGDVCHPAMVREMILTVLKAGRESRDRAGLKLMTSTLKELRYTAKVFEQYRGVRKVTIFGSARVMPDSGSYQLAKSLASTLAQCGYMVITGGGQGIMRAGNEGAGEKHSFAVNIRLPFEDGGNNIMHGSPRSITYKYFFNRKVAFIKEADAVALFAGGFGTLDEAMEVLTLVQTGKRYPIPLILVDQPEGTYWSNWKSYVERELLARGYINSEDLSLFTMVDSVKDAVEVINRFYYRYHSLRFFANRLVIRLQSTVDAENISRWKKEFSDILEPGGNFCLSQALPEEEDEPEIFHLPRLILDFNRKYFSRLRQLIDAINRA